MALVGSIRRAAAEPPYVLVEGSSDDPATWRLVSELRSAGVVVVRSDRSAPGAPVDAVVRVGPSANVRVWWVDRGGVLTGEPEVMESHPGDDPAVSAVRTAEILRARLLRSERPSPEPETVAPTAPAVLVVVDAPRAPSNPSSSWIPSMPSMPVSSAGAPPRLPSSDAPPARPPRPRSSGPSLARFGFDAGALVIFSPGGVPPAFDLALAVRWLPVRRLAVRAIAAVPVVPPSVSSNAGRASIDEWLLGGTIAWGVLPPNSPWAAAFGAGAAAARFQTKGAAAYPLQSASGDAWMAVPFIDVSGSRSLGSPHVRAGAHLLLGTALPRVALRFADVEVAQWGGVLVGAEMGIEVDAY